MKKIGIVNVLVSAVLTVTAFGGVASAMETTAGDSMIKKDEVMMQKDAMVQKNVMTKSDIMMSTDMDLYFGSRGDSVVTLQTFLESQGFLTIPAGVSKGYFGPLTKVAVMKYQESSGVRSTGYYGPLTRAAMSRSMMMKDGDSMMKKDGDAMMQKTGQ